MRAGAASLPSPPLPQGGLPRPTQNHTSRSTTNSPRNVLCTPGVQLPESCPAGPDPTPSCTPIGQGGTRELYSQTPTPPSPWIAPLGGVQGMWQVGERSAKVALASTGNEESARSGMRRGGRAAETLKRTGCKAVSAMLPGREAAHANKLSRGVLPPSSIS